MEPVFSPSSTAFDLAVGAQVLLAGPGRRAIHVEALSAARLDYFVGAFAWGDLNHEEVMASLRLFVDGVLRPLLD
jgi:hypothetical protein